MTNFLENIEGPESKRRKVRKGTHSCWECRRRKIRCQFSSADETVCIGCRSRNTACRSQEFVDDGRLPAAPRTRSSDESELAQRLGRLEGLMERLVERMIPDASTPLMPAGSDRSTSPSPAEENHVRHHHEVRPDIGGATALPGGGAPSGLFPSLHHTDPASTPTTLAPDLSAGRSSAGSRARTADIGRSLHALFPSRQTIATLLRESPGTLFITRLLYSNHAIASGQAEPASAMARIPPPDAPPALLAKRLLQLAICVQQLSPTFDYSTLPCEARNPTTLSQAMAAALSRVMALVTSDDDLATSPEGLQCLVLLGYWHANAGNLRKAWLVFRRGIAVGQLLGIERALAAASSATAEATGAALQSCLTLGNGTCAAHIWSRIVFCDRFLALLLGLPAGSIDDGFASVAEMTRETATERLEKQHSVITGRIAMRNTALAGAREEAYAATLAIDGEMERATKIVGAEWWREMAGSGDRNGHEAAEEAMERKSGLMLQMHHHLLVVLLHLPYLLRRQEATGGNLSRYEYSRMACLQSSREVLRRFVMFRAIVESAFSCRHVDYSAFIAAMTLVLGYLDAQQEQKTDWSLQRDRDRELVVRVKERMEKVFAVNGDRLSHESAAVIARLLPILDAPDMATISGAAGGNSDPLYCLTLEVPYLGTVKINYAAPTTNTGRPGAAETRSPGFRNAEAQPTEFRGQNAAMLHNDMSQRAMPTPTSCDSFSASAGEETMPSLSIEPVFTPALDMATAAGGTGDPSVMDVLDMEPWTAWQSPAAPLAYPDLTAEAEDWAFQGVDTTYWSLLYGGLGSLDQ